MNSKANASILALICLTGFLMSCGGPGSTYITATGGTPQNAVVYTAYALPLQATVTSGGSAASNVPVTFTAPASGASGTFAKGTATETDMTNGNGMATSSVFTANATVGGPYTVSASTPGASTPASFSLTNTAAGAQASITATSGTPQNAVAGTAFGLPLQATVTSPSGAPASGVTVTFTAPASGSSGTFASNGTATEMETTDTNGVATSSTFTANATVGGPYTVSASTPGASTPASFSLTNTQVVISSNYVFYMSGQLATCSACFYDLAGAVAIATDGTVVAGEQDYNCTCARGSPEPSGDKITGGMLTVSPTTGQGTLTLTTNNAYAGVNGTETFAVQFADTNHALISQFDGSATSSGSMDLQTLTSPPSLGSGSYAFILSGVDSYPGAVAYGGVFTIPSSGTTLQNGVYDANDSLTPNGVTRGTTLSGTFTEPDSFGRGTITSSLLDPASGGQIPLNYYVVDPETIRLISVDDSPGIYGGAVVGSAFGQGTNANTANNASLGSSVFAIAGNPFVAGIAALGQFSTSNTSSSTANFSGIASTDDLVTNSSGASFNAQISGTYSIASNGYGTLTITPGDLPDYMSSMGIYLTDPGLNLMDPSNGLGGGEFSGGALILDVDQNLGLAGVTGVIIPQTNTSTAAFAGNYAVGAQDFNSFNPSSTCPNPSPGNILCEFDLVGQGSVASLALSGTAQINDPDFTLTTNATDSVGFSGTPVADPNNPGRYTLYPEYDAPNSLELTFDYGVAPRDLDMVIYQANAGLLFWLEVDSNGVWLGPLEQMGSLAGIPAARKGAVKSAMPKQNPPARSR